MIFKKLIYSNKKIVWLQTCESCKAIRAENIEQVVRKESHEAVFMSFNEWEQIHLLLLQHNICWNTTEKRKLEKYHLGTRLWVP